MCLFVQLGQRLAVGHRGLLGTVCFSSRRRHTRYWRDWSSDVCSSDLSLLMDGIGDTVRVSLTADPVEEVKVAWEILKALGLRERGPVMIACPSCGRDNVGVHLLAQEVEERLRDYPQAFEVAVMGCAVNGPGEAGDADFGIAGGRDTGFVYAHGRVLKKAASGVLVDELFREIDAWIEGGMVRPERLKLAKPAAVLMAEAAQRPA